MERKKSEDSIRSSITFLDKDDQEIKKHGAANTLDNVSEQQDLEDMHEAVVNIDNKKLQIAENHE